MRRGHRVPRVVTRTHEREQKAEQHLEGAGTTEKDRTASAERTTLGLTRSVASQKEFQARSREYRRDDSHGTVARRARERVDLEDLLEQGRPAAGGMGSSCIVSCETCPTQRQANVVRNHCSKADFAFG